MINLNSDARCYRCEPYQGVFNINGHTLNCDTYCLVNYDSDDNPNDATLNVGSGRVNAPSGFQTRYGGRTTLTSGIIHVGYFIVYAGTNDGVFDMDGGNVYISSYLRVDNGAYFYCDGGTVYLTGGTTVYIHGTTGVLLFNNLTITKSGTSVVRLTRSIGVSGILDVQSTGATGGHSGGIEPEGLIIDMDP